MPGPSGSPQLERLQFVDGLAQATGLDPKVVETWVHVEGADAPGGTGGFNYLNVRAKGARGYSGVPIPTTSQNGFAQFYSVADAITETAYWINSMPNYSTIRSATHLGPRSQLAAIAASPWDAGHYGGGRKLYDAYDSLTRAGKSIAGKIGSAIIDAGSGNPWAVPGDLTGGGGPIGGILTAAQAPVKIANDFGTVVGLVANTQNWLRGGYIIGGGIMVLLGAVLLAKSVGALNAMPSSLNLGGGGGDKEAEDMYANRSYRSSREGISKADSKGPSFESGIGRPLRAVKPIPVEPIPF